MPDGHYINSTGSTSIDWPDLPPTARTAHVLPQLDPHSLVSIGVLCDHDCIATFDKKPVQIHQHNKQILHGIRLPNGLWTCMERVLPASTGKRMKRTRKSLKLKITKLRKKKSGMMTMTMTWEKMKKMRKLNMTTCIRIRATLLLCVVCHHQKGRRI